MEDHRATPCLATAFLINGERVVGVEFSDGISTGGIQPESDTPGLAARFEKRIDAESSSVPRLSSQPMLYLVILSRLRETRMLVNSFSQRVDDRRTSADGHPLTVTEHQWLFTSIASSPGVSALRV